MTRQKVVCTLREFMVKKFREVKGFTPEQILEMAIEQVNVGLPLVILTNTYEFVIPPESISAFADEADAPPATPSEGPVVEESESGPDLPGEL